MRLLGLADACRAAGLTVVEVDGWEDRGDDFSETPKVLLWHHTATSALARGDYPSLGIVRDGRPKTATSPGLSGPLSQLGLGRSGTVYVIAAGKANHAGAGAWDGITASSSTVGIEAESPGDGTWTDEQRAAYPRLAAAVTRYLGTTPRRNCAHREWALPAGRKPDPTGIDMPAMRARVAQLLIEEDDEMSAEDSANLKKIATWVEWWGTPDDDPNTPADESQPNSKGEGMKRIRDIANGQAEVVARIGALEATVSKLAAGDGDPAAVQAAARAGAEEALRDLRLVADQ